MWQWIIGGWEETKKNRSTTFTNAKIYIYRFMFSMLLVYLFFEDSMIDSLDDDNSDDDNG